MGHSIPVDPEDSTVIHVGDLEPAVDPWITSSSFTEDHLSHPPLIVELLCNLLCHLDDHVITRSDTEECWRLGPFEWTDRRSNRL